MPFDEKTEEIKSKAQRGRKITNARRDEMFKSCGEREKGESVRGNGQHDFSEVAHAVASSTAVSPLGKMR